VFELSRRSPHSPRSGARAGARVRRRRGWAILDRLTSHGPAGDRADRGAVAAMVAVLLAGGVLLGSLALVVDVGPLYVEREELQSGADAAALALAQACASGGTECDTVGAIDDAAQRYADLNAGDGLSSVVDVCGRLPGKLLECPPANGNLTDCLGALPESPAPYVEVRLGTELPGDRFVLPPTFAQALAGNAGYGGVSVGACARATWDSPAVHILDLTVSTCEFNQDTSDGRDFANPPPYPPYPSPTEESLIGFGSGDVCVGPLDDYWHAPGPAGFLDGDDPACEAVLPGNGEVWGSYLALPTFLPPANCETRLRQAGTHREVVYLPVHDAVHETANRTQFRVVYLVPFVVTGFSFDTDGTSGHSETSWLATPPCDQCVSGLFVGPPVALAAVAARLIG
jgi:Flp pilus assembly protein TadG